MHPVNIILHILSTNPIISHAPLILTSCHAKKSKSLSGKWRRAKRRPARLVDECTWP